MKTKLSFEDLSLGDGDYVTLAEYQGLTWTSFYGYDPSKKHIPDGGSYGPGYGYLNGLASGQQEAFSAWGETATISDADGRFNLKRAWLTSAYVESESVTVLGYRDGAQVYDLTVAIHQSTATLIEFGFDDIDSVSFRSASGSQIVFDNMVFGHHRVPAEAPSFGRAFAHADAAPAHDTPLQHAYLPQPDYIQLA